jgi:hypothetical protein
MKPPLFFSPAYAQPSVWTDKSTYAVGETVTITMTYTQMMGVAYWVIVYKPDGSSFKLTFAQNSNSVTTTADQAGDWRVELWSQVVAPNTTPTLQGTCTFTVTSGPCPQHIIYITVTTSKPIYNVGDTIVVLWDASQIPQGAIATLTLQGPSGTYNFNLDYSALMAGSYTVGQAEQKDVGQWTASLAGSAQSGGCPSPFQGSTTFQVGQAPPTTDLIASSCGTIPDSPKAGDSVKFWVDFNIVGGAPPYVFNYQMFLDGNLMQTLPSSPVQFNAGGLQSITTDTTWTATSGSHTARWVLNQDHMLQESNYNNNEVSCSFTVGGYQITLDSVATDVPAWVLMPNPWPHVGYVTFSGTTYSQLPATATAQSGWYDVSATPPSGECTGAGGVQCFSFVFDHWEIGEGVTQVDKPNSQNARVQVQGSGHVTAYYKVTTSGTKVALVVECLNLDGNVYKSADFSYTPGESVTIDPSICGASASALSPALVRYGPAMSGEPMQVQEAIPIAVVLIASGTATALASGIQSFPMPANPSKLGILTASKNDISNVAGSSKQGVSNHIQDDAQKKVDTMAKDAANNAPYSAKIETPGGKVITATSTLVDLAGCFRKHTDKEKWDCVESLQWLGPTLEDMTIDSSLGLLGLPFEIRYGYNPIRNIHDLTSTGSSILQIAMAAKDWLSPTVSAVRNILQQVWCDILKFLSSFLPSLQQGSCFKAGSDVTLLATDSSGRRTGTVYENSAWHTYTEDPNAWYSGPDSHPQYIYAPEPPSQYQLTISGRQSGNYAVQAVDLTTGNIVYQTTNTIGAGEVQTTKVGPPVTLMGQYAFAVVVLIVAAVGMWQVHRRSRPRVIDVEESPRVLSQR